MSKIHKVVSYFMVSIILIMGSVYLYADNYPANNHHTITMTDEGFVPNKLEIEKGDTVNFSSNRSGEFWPASNDHPIHTDYTEFDPKRPLKEDEVWSFTFDKSGEWYFHDHLYPLYSGTISVR